MHLTTHFWNPYDKTINLTLFSDKSEHITISDQCETLKVNGGHLDNATICGISEKMLLMLCLHSLPNLTLLTDTAQ